VHRQWPCLANNTKIFNFIFTFSKNNQHQNTLTFFTFYITSIIFYYYSNKKIYYNTIFFLLFYTHSFYFILHLSLLTNSKILFHYSVMFCYLPNKANVLTCLLPTVTLGPHWLIFLLNLLTNPSVDFNYFVDVEHLVIDYSKRIIILSTYHEYFLAHKTKLSP
jgi:hypothetical protein